jgi:hypothetical protein
MDYQKILSMLPLLKSIWKSSIPFVNEIFYSQKFSLTI